MNTIFKLGKNNFSLSVVFALMWIFYIRLYYHLVNLAPGYLKESE